MEKDDARKILPLVNNNEVMEALKCYGEVRVAHHKKQLEDCDLNMVSHHQAAIKELKRFTTLRDEVKEKLKETI